MSQDLPIPRQDTRSDGVAVVEWGGPEPTPPGRAGRSLAGLGRDRRLPLLPAGLGVAAAFASLVGEWLVMTVPNGGPEGNATLRVPGGVSDVGGFGVGYLVGLFALAAAVALALRGTPAVRHNARVAGLALAAALLGVLVATAFSLDDSGQRTFFYSPEDGFRIEYGRGLVMAFVACALLAAALHLAGRVPVPGPTGRESAPVDGAGPADPEAEPEPGHWGWRGGPPRSGRDADLPAAPADLTVQPTVPFARPEPPA
ncbi:hypothetical protein C5N14_12055 [Micromonospora sp. MW-13]|uniref:hypothetical protein n=1 Tax=Micromonospora sp. MW-13 TaxID=2094022 RepID=UPI000E438E38|nr:hypothetical protein [Micromonospora sp. MW-13]RGC68722.1 hypothetical protein C5N14_12055 [Micromonospora sp. MW-13]